MLKNRYEDIIILCFKDTCNFCATSEHLRHNPLTVLHVHFDDLDARVQLAQLPADVGQGQHLPALAVHFRSPTSVAPLEEMDPV